LKKNKDVEDNDIPIKRANSSATNATEIGSLQSLKEKLT